MEPKGKYGDAYIGPLDLPAQIAATVQRLGEGGAPVQRDEQTGELRRRDHRLCQGQVHQEAQELLW
jgi:hypothetical protein